MANFHESNSFTITKAPDWIQKWIICMAVVSMHHNIKIFPTIQCKFLLILKMEDPVLIGICWMQLLNSAYPLSMIWFTDKFAYLWKQTELLDCSWF